MKKLFVIFCLLQILCLVACNKEEIEVEESHNYAVNEVREKEDIEETEELEEYLTDESIVNQDTDYELATSAVYVYPTNSDEKYMINGVNMGEIIPHGFVFRGTSYKSSQLDELSKYCIDHHIYAPGYKVYINLSDTREADYQCLSDIYVAIESIKIGRYVYTLDDLLYPIENFEDLYAMLDKNYELILEDKSHNDNLYDNTIETYENEYFGNTYIWRFSVEDIDDEYDSKTLSNIDNNVKGYIELKAIYNQNDSLMMYTLSYHKCAHFWANEIMKTITHIEYIEELDDLIAKYGEDYEMDSSNEIKTHEQVPTGEYIYEQDGYCYDNAFMKIIDGSYIGLDNFSITIHNEEQYKSAKVVFLVE